MTWYNITWISIARTDVSSNKCLIVKKSAKTNYKAEHYYMVNYDKYNAFYAVNNKMFILLVNHNFLPLWHVLKKKDYPQMNWKKKQNNNA